MKIKPVKTIKEANSTIDFLCSSRAFDLEMTEFRINARKKGVLDSLKKDNQRFWFTESNGEVVGAIGIAENERENGGYYLHYFAVDIDYRNKGIGSKLLQLAEDFVKDKKGRFVLIDTGSIEIFQAARNFYQKHGYKKVGRIPDYYDPGDDCIYYYKKV